MRRYICHATKPAGSCARTQSWYRHGSIGDLSHGKPWWLEPDRAGAGTAFDASRDDPILFRPGDTVGFTSVDAATFTDLDARAAKGEMIITLSGTPLVGQLMRAIRIDTAGPHTTVQDIGRAGHQALGVPEGGVLDRDAVRLANALVGNVLMLPCLRFASAVWG